MGGQVERRSTGWHGPLTRFTPGKTMRVGRNGEIDVPLDPNGPLYFTDRGLQLRTGNGLALAPGSPVALVRDSIAASQVADDSGTTPNVADSIRRIIAAIATINATIAALGGASWTETEIDFGSAPVAGGSFTVVDAAVSGTSKVVVVPSGAAPTGGYADVWEWDTLTFAATAGAGQFTLHAAVANGTTNGKRKVFYQVS